MKMDMNKKSKLGFIAENQFSGEIPEEICNINIDPWWEGADMSELIFNNNQFCPSYPICIEEFIDIDTQEISNCFMCDGSNTNEIELWGNCYHTEYTTEIIPCLGGNVHALERPSGEYWIQFV